MPDLPAARGYYDALLPLVGLDPFLVADNEFVYRPVGDQPGGVRVAAKGIAAFGLYGAAPAAVRAVHDHVIANGGTGIEPPGRYYAIFW
ncbi:hypothetical protein [Mycobacterium servetii]|uniref:hypothetical protein n=1 Tax=Mycobacterium servetii TaxID=3237418 RepID=UPI00350FACA6